MFKDGLEINDANLSENEFKDPTELENSKSRSLDGIKQEDLLFDDELIKDYAEGETDTDYFSSEDLKNEDIVSDSYLDCDISDSDEEYDNNDDYSDVELEQLEDDFWDDLENGDGGYDDSFEEDDIMDDDELGI